MTHDWIVPDWPAPPGVRSLITTRSGGVSDAAYASMNLGEHLGDDARAWRENRRRLRCQLPSEPLWMRQVHGVGVIEAQSWRRGVEADGAVARSAGAVIGVLTADCLPVLFCDVEAKVVGVAHAGWRGLAAGILEATIEKMAIDPGRLMAYLGPGIGVEVGVGVDVVVGVCVFVGVAVGVGVGSTNLGAKKLYCCVISESDNCLLYKYILAT